MSATSETIFNGLNGQEALEYIMLKVKQAAINTGEFPTHLTKPLMKIEVDLKIWAYPKDDLNGAPGVTVTVTEGNADGTPTATFKNGEIVDTPDKARFDAGLPIPKPQPTVHGVVDIKQDQPLPESKPESVTVEVKSHHNPHPPKVK